MEDLQYKLENSIPVLEAFIEKEESLGKDSLLEEEEKIIVADLMLRKEKIIKDTENIIKVNLMKINYKKNM